MYILYIYKHRHKYSYYISLKLYLVYLFVLYIQHFTRILNSATGLETKYSAVLIPLLPPIFSMGWKNGI